MVDLRRFGLLDLLFLLGVLALAGGTRAGYLLLCADSGRTAGPLVVQDRQADLPNSPAGPAGTESGTPPTEVDVLVNSLQQRHSFASRAPFAEHEEPTAHASPGYPWLLSWLARLVPEGSLPRAVRWLQVGLGTLTAGFYFFFARRAFRSLLVGVLAGVLAGLDPFWIVSVSAVADGVVAAFLLGLVLMLAARAGETGGAVASLLFGLGLAGLALVRAALLPFAFVAIIWFLWRSRCLHRGWLAALLALLGFLNGLLPWTVRNIQVFHEPVPVVDSAYLHLWIGNNPEATGGPATQAMLRNAPVQELQAISHQPRRYASLAPRVWREVGDRPAETIHRRLKAAIIFFTGAQWLEDGTLAEQVRGPEGDTMPAWLQTGYPLLFQAALAGLLLLGLLGWRWTYGWRWESLPAVLALVCVPLPYILGHGEALSGPRLPLDGVLISFAAFVLACLNPLVRVQLLEAIGAGPSKS
jgi:4-amino-4-deoxy-L-arabinose transferase-like glycosyltransferase